MVPCALQKRLDLLLLKVRDKFSTTIPPTLVLATQTNQLILDVAALQGIQAAGITMGSRKPQSCNPKMEALYAQFLLPSFTGARSGVANDFSGNSPSYKRL